jgi:hypothetical protein
LQGEKLLGSLGGLFSRTWKPKKTAPVKGPVVLRGLFHFSCSKIKAADIALPLISLSQQMILFGAKVATWNRGKGWD